LVGAAAADKLQLWMTMMTTRTTQAMTMILTLVKKLHGQMISLSQSLQLSSRRGSPRPMPYLEAAPSLLHFNRVTTQVLVPWLHHLLLRIAQTTFLLKVSVHHLRGGARLKTTTHTAAMQATTHGATATKTETSHLSSARSTIRHYRPLACHG
jgi:hypothetical protein